MRNSHGRNSTSIDVDHRAATRPLTMAAVFGDVFLYESAHVHPHNWKIDVSSAAQWTPNRSLLMCRKKLTRKKLDSFFSRTNFLRAQTFPLCFFTGHYGTFVQFCCSFTMENFLLWTVSPQWKLKRWQQRLSNPIFFIDCNQLEVGKWLELVDLSQTCLDNTGTDWWQSWNFDTRFPVAEKTTLNS